MHCKGEDTGLRGRGRSIRCRASSGIVLGWHFGWVKVRLKDDERSHDS